MEVLLGENKHSSSLQQPAAETQSFRNSDSYPDTRSKQVQLCKRMAENYLQC